MKISLALKRRLMAVHRWVSLTVLVFWLAQVATGFAIVFHWELDDALIPTTAPSVPANASALGNTIETLTAAAGPGWSFASLWATGGTPGRFDISIENPSLHLSQTIRVSGDGTELRRTSEDNWITQVVTFHQNFLAGDLGTTIVGLSGFVLFINIVMGLVLAWPGVAGFRRAFSPSSAAEGPPRTFAWHRALGLGVALPAMLLVACGVMMSFEDTGLAGLHTAPRLPPAAPSSEKANAAQILDAAMTRYPDATLTALLPPDDETPFYVVRLRQPGELRRVFGKTTLYVADSGEVVMAIAPEQRPPGNTFLDNLYPLHTGEAGGLVGRFAVMAVGLGLLTVMAFGLRLWWLRRRPTQ